MEASGVDRIGVKEGLTEYGDGTKIPVKKPLRMRKRDDKVQGQKTREGPV